MGLARMAVCIDFRDMMTVLQYTPIRIGLILLLLLSAPVAEPVLAQALDTEQEKEYRICMQMTRVDPSAAFERALGMQDLGGGVPARHCAAVALMHLGQYEEAAKRFEAMAGMMPDDAPADIVSDILAHAGIAWMEAGNLDRAHSVQTAALDLTPNSPVILVDRSMVLAQGGHYWEAIDDLNRALELNNTDPAAFAMRASAYRYVEANELAMDDVERALRLDPDHPEALLERGILHRIAGNSEAARRDWLRLITLHDGRPAAEDARRNLELLDVEKPVVTE